MTARSLPPPPDPRTPRPWSIYGPDGTWLHDCTVSEAAIRATLPAAVVDAVIGAVTLAPRGHDQPAEDSESEPEAKI